MDRLKSSVQKGSTTKLQAAGRPFIETFAARFKPKVVDEEEKTEDDISLEYLEKKPWRAPKVKNLKVIYRPWKDNWRERYRTEDEDTIYMYSIPENYFAWDDMMIKESWNWPWMWSKLKAERLSWIHRLFYEECEALPVQEHMEMDAFFSDFDMPTRWGLLRVKEMDVLNVLALNVAFFTDFTGVKPTDLGLRPDGSVRACPVQFHNCISSSNSPLDTDHYAPPLKWDRSKSPDQAYEEVKSVYFNYPKRGLKWSSGWIDRGGWKPQQFGGNYFNARAESLVWHYADDVELVLDVENREVLYRSSTRLGQSDWDVERLRYNQITRMLTARGGWEVAPLPRLYYYTTTPYRWTELLLDKAFASTERAADAVIAAIQGAGAGTDDDGQGIEGGARRAIEGAVEYVAPFVRPIEQQAERLARGTVEGIAADPRVSSAIEKAARAQETLERAAQEVKETVNEYIERASKILNSEAGKPAIKEGADSAMDGGASEEMSGEDIADFGTRPRETMDTTAKAPPAIGGSSAPPVEGEGSTQQSQQSAFSGDSDRDSLDGINNRDAAATAGTSDVPVSDKAAIKSSDDVGSPTAAKKAARSGLQRRAGSSSGNRDRDSATASNDVEFLLEAEDGPGDRTGSGSGSSRGRPRQGQRADPIDISSSERRVMKARLDELRKEYNLYPPAYAE